MAGPAARPMVDGAVPVTVGVVLLVPATVGAVAAGTVVVGVEGAAVAVWVLLLAELGVGGGVAR
jgi:hypothetical protein